MLWETVKKIPGTWIQTHFAICNGYIHQLSQLSSWNSVPWRIWLVQSQSAPRYKNVSRDNANLHLKQCYNAIRRSRTDLNTSSVENQTQGDENTSVAFTGWYFNAFNTSFSQIKVMLFDKQQDSRMKLKVIGAGLMRTGTSSLKVALEQLLGEPCYHISRVAIEDRQPSIQKW